MPQPMRFSWKNGFVGFIIFCAILLLLNGLLSFLGLEKYDKEFIPRSSYPIFDTGAGEAADQYVTTPHFLNSINHQQFPIKKVKEVTRIFVIGGSAAFAWPYTEEYGFTGYLRRSLGNLAPGKFEIINAAGMSFGSHRVYDVLQDVIELEPDLVIVYSGNNEYVERNVISRRKKKHSAFEAIGSLSAQTPLYRAVRLGIYRSAPSIFRQKTDSDIDLTDLRADSIVSRGVLGRSSEIDIEVLANYRNNIAAMRNLLLENGVKVIFCTTPSNVAGFPPTSPPVRFTNESDASQWKKMQQEAISIIDQKDPATDSTERRSLLQHCEQILHSMLQIDQNNPWTHYALGAVYQQMGDFDRAYLEFVQAKDLDARPVRALSSFNSAVRSIVEETGDEQKVMLFDLEASLSQELRSGNANWLYLDYCHFTEAGHKLVAINMAPVIQRILGTGLDLNQLSFSIFNDDSGAQKGIATQHNVLFASGATHAHIGRYEEAEKDFKKIVESYEEGTVGIFPSSVYRALSFVYQGLGKKELHKEWLLKAIDANPENFEALVSGGFLFLEEGDLAEAEKMFHNAIRFNKYAPLAFEGLGRIALMKGFAAEAIANFENALRLGANGFLLQKELGRAYLLLGKIDKAVLAWQEARSFDTANQEILNLLKQYSQQSSQ